MSRTDTPEKPFLVSRIYQIIDENFYKNKKVPWTLQDIDKSVKSIIAEVNTLFESLVKNLENNSDLYEAEKNITKKVLSNYVIILMLMG